jgi:calcium permeable stress-gated cation channel
MKGGSYPIALHQLLGGVYLSSICLAGLMGISKSWAPMALMLVFLVVIIAFQVLVGIALDPLQPVSRPSDVKDDLTDQSVSHQYQAEEVRPPSDGERTTVGEEYEMKPDVTNDTNDPQQVNRQRQAAEKTNLPEFATENGTPAESTSTDKKNLKGNFLTRRLAPYVHQFYLKAKPMVADCHDDAPEYERGHIDEAYLNPAIYAETPIIWLAKDNMGLSTHIVAENKESGLMSSDEGAWLNEKNKVEWSEKDFEEKVPIYQKALNY